MSDKTGLFSFSDLVLGFIQLTRERWPNATFPIWHSTVWDVFFYDIKKKLGPEFPELEQIIGLVEWDSPHPHIPKLSDVLSSAYFRGNLQKNEDWRMYPTIELKHRLPSSLFQAMLEIGQKHEGLIQRTD